MSGITFTAITDVISGLSIGNSGYIGLVGLLLTTITAVAITRNVQKLKIIHLPLGLAWSAVGVQVGIIPIIIYGVIYISAVFGIRNIGEVITGSAEKVSTAWQEGTAFVSDNAMKKREERQYDREQRKHERTFGLQIGKELRQADFEQQRNKALEPYFLQKLKDEQRLAPAATIQKYETDRTAAEAPQRYKEQAFPGEIPISPTLIKKTRKEATNAIRRRYS